MIEILSAILMFLVFLWGLILFWSYSSATRGWSNNWDAVILVICSFAIGLEFPLIFMFIARWLES